MNKVDIADGVLRGVQVWETFSDGSFSGEAGWISLFVEGGVVGATVAACCVFVGDVGVGGDEFAEEVVQCGVSVVGDDGDVRCLTVF
jgi:hypothetical protein